MTLEDDPFEHGVTPDLIAELSSPVGFVILNWAFIEMYMAAVVEATSGHMQNAGRRSSDPANTATASRRCKKIFQLPDLKPYADRFAKVEKRLALLAPIRHAFSHGTISAFDPEQRISLEMFPGRPTCREILLLIWVPLPPNSWICYRTR